MSKTKLNQNGLEEIGGPIGQNISGSNNGSPNLNKENKKPQSFFKVAMLIWGLPLLLFIVVGILKECNVL